MINTSLTSSNRVYTLRYYLPFLLLPGRRQETFYGLHGECCIPIPWATTSGADARLPSRESPGALVKKRFFQVAEHNAQRCDAALRKIPDAGVLQDDQIAIPVRICLHDQLILHDFLCQLGAGGADGRVPIHDKDIVRIQRNDGLKGNLIAVGERNTGAPGCVIAAFAAAFSLAALTAAAPATAFFFVSLIPAAMSAASPALPRACPFPMSMPAARSACW